MRFSTVGSPHSPDAEVNLSACSWLADELPLLKTINLIGAATISVEAVLIQTRQRFEAQYRNANTPAGGVEDAAVANFREWLGNPRLVRGGGLDRDFDQLDDFAVGDRLHWFQTWQGTLLLKPQDEERDDAAFSGLVQEMRPEASARAAQAAQQAAWNAAHAPVVPVVQAHVPVVRRRRRPVRAPFVLAAPLRVAPQPPAAVQQLAPADPGRPAAPGPMDGPGGCAVGGGGAAQQAPTLEELRALGLQAFSGSSVSDKSAATKE